MTATLPPSDKRYFIDPENAAEMARLTHQDRLVTQAMGGLFPERSDLSSIHAVLDIACGPGEWPLSVAATYPHMRVVGIDISSIMIAYAAMQAQVRAVDNVTFSVMDALQPFDFPTHTFDLINARFIFGFMSPAAAERCVSPRANGISPIAWPMRRCMPSRHRPSRKLAGVFLLMGVISG